ncbi:fimbria/pilus outer membrane usher protein, partial [Salmonella enterica subsp. enterica serovar Enteritidis]|nr:fimbria/pilus outer membrane usher protein [Salmonella enterica subsp. enterica serovar Enteritidis]
EDCLCGLIPSMPCNQYWFYIQSTGTNFTVAGYRYSTKDYYALEDVLDTYSDNSHYDHVRNRTDLSLSQDIIYGSISLTLYNEDYWNDTHT